MTKHLTFFILKMRTLNFKMQGYRNFIFVFGQ